MLQQSQDCVKILSVDGALDFMNDNGKRIMEIDSFELIVGSPWWTLWPDESQLTISDAVTRALDGEDSRFEAFCPTAKGTPRWWDVMVSPIRDDRGNITHILSTSRDVTAAREEREAERNRAEAEFARAEAAKQMAELQTAIAQESRHRLKNLLTVVSSLASLVGKHSTNVVDFQNRLKAHLDHIARAQDLLIGTHRKSVTLREAVLAIVEADDRLRIADIPRESISDQSVQLLALSLGELQTNAIKHGALAVDNGSVVLKLTSAENGIHIVWTEDCRERRAAPALVNGSGIALLKRMLTLQSDGIFFDWTGSGLRISFTLPRI